MLCFFIVTILNLDRLNSMKEQRVGHEQAKKLFQVGSYEQ